MEKLVGSRVRAIGVSNFSIRHLEKLLKTARIVPAVLQVELHPYFPQWDLVNYCANHNIHGTDSNKNASLKMIVKLVFPKQ